MALRLPEFLKRPEPGVWVSAAAHGAILVAALAAFAAPPLPQAEEGIPVEVMTESQFAEVTKGQRDGKTPTADAKPRVDRVADKVEQRDPGEAKQDVPSPPQRPPEMKTAEAEELPPPTPPLRPALEQPTSVSVPTPPDPVLEAKQQEAARAEAERKAAARAAAAAEKAAAEKAEAQRREAAAKEKLIERQEAEAEARAEAKRAAEARAKAEEAKRVADAKAAEAKRQADAKAKADADARAEMQKKIAEADAKAQADAKAAEAKAAAAAEAKRVADAKARADKARADAEAKARAKAELAAKFDAGAISALVASRQPAQSSGATGREVQRVASLGAETGTAQKLSPSQRDALVGILQAQIEKCYSAPPGAASGIVLPVLDIRLGPDGNFTSEPRLMRGGASSIDAAIAQAALRAVRRCAPYRIPAQFAPFYNDWKVINATFDLPHA